MKQSEKPKKFVSTLDWNEMYGGLEAALYASIAQQIWENTPVDMLVFDYPQSNIMTVKAHGYHADTGDFIDKVVFTTPSLEIKKFWLKYDDYGDFWLGTFLFPDEY